MTIQHFYRYLSLHVWGRLPGTLQRKISRIYANIYNQSFTRFIIKPYCILNYKDPAYLDQFRSATGTDYYRSFQDFFTRVYRQLPEVKSEYIWPCEGLLCDYGQVKVLPAINIKGDIREVSTIFGQVGKQIPDDYYFSNVFLHNNNYHRIHAPVSGKITHIEHIEGELVLLRPWVYQNEPSLPAIRNERVNLVITDKQNRPWYLSIVGGPAVGTIVLHPSIVKGASIDIISELGLFLLGSTCCIASPKPTTIQTGHHVSVGDCY